MNVRLLLLLPALAMTAPALGQAAPQPLEPLFACREIADPQARLTCLDAAVEALHARTETGDVVAVARQQIEAAEEATFGLSIPNFRLPRFGGAGSDDAELAEAAEAVSAASTHTVIREEDGDIERIEGLAVTELEENRSGKAVITLANGQRWVQTDQTHVSRLSRGAQPGMTASIRTGALGSYFMQLSTSTRWFRAERTQ
ncbi:hypothetical protein [Maricaulis sp. CAU 1757]